VSGIAWAGVTSPTAQAGASLFQAALPTPTVGQCLHLNAFLEQLRSIYQPLLFRHDVDVSKAKLMCVADSSLGNNARYSQGGFVILVAEDSAEHVCGNCTVLNAKSSKSKRVASSTMSAETLALMAAQEESSFLQSFLHELLHPGLSAAQLLQVPDAELMPCDCATDCGDLYESLVQPASPTPTNRSMVLYLAALREAHQTRRVRTWVWCDTEDNIANGLTKLNADGTLPADDMASLLRDSYWEPQKVYRWAGLLTSPSRPVHRPCIVSTSPTKTTTTTTNDDSNKTTDSNKTDNHKTTGPMPIVYAIMPQRTVVHEQPHEPDTMCAYEWASESES
jgi:hypothetical protein